jgi:signal transduction histidine kinase
MKISYFIFFSFLFILLLFSITTYINFKQSEEVRENSEWVSKSSVIIRHSSRFQRNILNMVSGLRGYLLTGEQYFIQTYDSAAMENESILTELSELIPENSFQKKSLTEILQLNQEWVKEFAYPLIEAKKKSSISDSSLVSFNKLYRAKFATGSERKINQQLQQKFKEFTNYEYNSRDARRVFLAESVQRTKDISFYLTSLSLIMGSIIAIFLAYRISSRIVMMVKMANQIAEGNYNVHMKVSGKDELSTLASSLNEMANVLAENITLLKRKNEELDQFAHIVSHDLKAPLRGIGNVVSWIEEDHKAELTPKIDEYLQIIKGRVIRAENLIGGILSYARIGKDELGKEYVNVNQLINEIDETLSISPHVLSVEKLPTVYTERLPLSQIFYNLISNAIKYNDKKKSRVKVYCKEHNSQYEFFVEDNGPGIAKNYHNKIFMIFQTLQERDSFESTGVGLAIVKKILDARDEKINLVSEPGKGSTFSFTWSKSL